MKIIFDIMLDGECVPNCYKQISCHIIFDVKMEDFRCKAKIVADGHMTKIPKCQIYSSVVSSETFCLALTISALNYRQVK